VVGLLVATPALIGQIVLGTLCRGRLRKLADFRSEVGRSIEHFYVTGDVETPLSAVSNVRAAAHHAHPGVAYGPVGDFDGYAMEHAAAKLEASVEALPFGGESPFVLIDEPADDPRESPIAAYANPEDDLAPVEEGYLFRTPFAEAEMNPIVRHTARILGGPQVAMA
jgi:hypothetical protein